MEGWRDGKTKHVLELSWHVGQSYGGEWGFREEKKDTGSSQHLGG